jgi:hypothetical protein
VLNIESAVITNSKYRIGILLPKKEEPTPPWERLLFQKRATTKPQAASGRLTI